MNPHGIQVCFCDLKGRPYDDWGAHQSYCLMLDWALANGKIDYGEWANRFMQTQTELGITDEEIAAEGRVLSAEPARVVPGVVVPPELASVRKDAGHGNG